MDGVNKNLTHIPKKQERKTMAEPMSIAVLTTSIVTLISVVFDKMRASKCRHILCCGCCEIDRDVDPPST